MLIFLARRKQLQIGGGGGGRGGHTLQIGGGGGTHSFFFFFFIFYFIFFFLGGDICANYWGARPPPCPPIPTALYLKHLSLINYLLKTEHIT